MPNLTEWKIWEAMKRQEIAELSDPQKHRNVKTGRPKDFYVNTAVAIKDQRARTRENPDGIRNANREWLSPEEFPQAAKRGISQIEAEISRARYDAEYRARNLIGDPPDETK